MKSILWVMDAGTAYDLWERFIYKEALSEEERLAICVEFVKAGRIQALGADLTKEEMASELCKHYSVLTVKKNG